MVAWNILNLPLFLLGLVQAYPNPKACSGVCTNSHDPSIIRRADGTYFRFSTGNKISIHTAPDLAGPWTFKGAMLPQGSKINLKGNNDLWAPDVQKVGNQYYVYYSVSSFGSRDSAIGLATSPSMDINTWTDRGSTGITSTSAKNYNAIDANLYSANGNYYMTFGSFWQDIFTVPMKSNPTSTNGASSHLAYTSDGQGEEGAFMFVYKGYYYLFYSKGQCCNYVSSKPKAGLEYKIMVCRSKNPTSGFVDKNGVNCGNGGGTLVLPSHDFVYGPGGQGVYNDPKYGPVVYYHYVDTRIGFADGDKRFGWNTLDFSSGWPVVKS
uniref:arabinan endo-1,5-alpha-L-arabinosidase n=1 Tax=Thraustotheca clavata TaxID=74557 RepID=A0A0A7CMI4_9STRA|nr:secreted protein [Thraustotheca clavata]